MTGSDQPSIVRCESVDSTEILRGLARSATGTSSTEDAVAVAGSDLVEIQVVAEDELAAEDPAGTLCGDQFLIDLEL